MSARTAIPAHDGVKAYWPLPEVGSIWRSRDGRDRKRTVEVLEAEEWGFIYIRTVATRTGADAGNGVRSRVRRQRWHYVYEPVENGSSTPGGSS